MKAAAVILGSEPQIQSENTVVNANDSRTTASLGARSRYRLVLIPYRLTFTVLFHFSVSQSQKIGANLNLKSMSQHKSGVFSFVGGMMKSWGAY